MINQNPLSILKHNFILAPIHHVQRGDQTPEPDNNPDLTLLYPEIVHPLSKLHKQGSNQLSGQFLRFSPLVSRFQGVGLFFSA